MGDQESDNYLHKWVSETCSIYQLGVVRLGVSQLVLGIISMALGGALMALNKGGAWAGIALWSGIPVCTFQILLVYILTHTNLNKFRQPKPNLTEGSTTTDL